MVMNLIVRVAAAQATIDQFLEKPFEWGTNDCAQLAAFAVEQLGFETVVSKAGRYKTQRGARRALARLGAKSMEDLPDAMGFERIAPAMALPGDIVGFPGGDTDAEEDRWTALGVCIGQDRILGFANGICDVGPFSVCTVAWRVA
jgi:hypothetical protein